MTEVMQGVRVLEVAEHTFVPAASALLADWGAEVIKIEHVSRGDAMRGLASTGVMAIAGDVHALLEHSNRGKKSLGLDLTSDEGLDILYKLAATADIFLTNKLPSVRTKLRIGLEEIRAHNPQIIYVRGTGQGSGVPTRTKAPTTAWLSGPAPVWPWPSPDPRYGHMVGPPGPGFGDSIGAMTIAGGMMGALFHRERTGEATVVDVSLLNSGMWAMGQAVALSLLMDMPWVPPSDSRREAKPIGQQLSDQRRAVSFVLLPAGRQVLGADVRGDRPGRPGRRPPIRRARIAARQQRRGHRHPGRRLRRENRGRMAEAAG